jgi:hypothetical protein
MVLGVRTPPDQAGAIRHSKPLVLVPDHLQTSRANSLSGFCTH